MRVKAYPVQIWFLDKDLNKSAEALTTKRLSMTINGCVSAMIAARFYFNGIRSMRFYKYYFSTERYYSTIDTYFTNWPFNKGPRFNKYNTKESKWCRMCNEHYEYVKTYLSVLLAEYAYRTGKPHEFEDFLSWELLDAPKLKIPNGNLKSIQLPWKNLNPKYRRKDIIEGYILQYKSLITHPLTDYKDSNIDIPDWIMNSYSLDI